MSTNTPNIAKSRWSEPKLYGILLALVLFVGSGAAMHYLVNMVNSYLHVEGIIVTGPSLGSASLPPVALIAVSAAAGVFLLKDARAKTTELFSLLALLGWTMVSIVFSFALLATIGEADLGRTVSTQAYPSALALWSANVLSWALYYNLYKSKVGGVFNIFE